MKTKIKIILDNKCFKWQIYNQINNKISINVGNVIESNLRDPIWNLISGQISFQIENEIKKQLS